MQFIHIPIRNIFTALLAYHAQ